MMPLQLYGGLLSDVGVRGHLRVQGWFPRTVGGVHRNSGREDGVDPLDPGRGGRSPKRPRTPTRTTRDFVNRRPFLPKRRSSLVTQGLGVLTGLLPHPVTKHTVNSCLYLHEEYSEVIPRLVPPSPTDNPDVPVPCRDVYMSVIKRALP